MKSQHHTQVNYCQHKARINVSVVFTLKKNTRTYVIISNLYINQTLQNMLCKYVHENKKNWDNFLDALSYAYNTSRHESTLHTPFEVMFGRKAILPIVLDVERPNAAKLLEDIEGADTGQSLEVLTSHRMEVLQEVKKNINLAQKKTKETV